jgi:hypothetical protein
MKLKEEFGEEKNSKGARGGRKLEEGNKPWLFCCIFFDASSMGECLPFVPESLSSWAVLGCIGWAHIADLTH